MTQPRGEHSVSFNVHGMISFELGFVLGLHPDAQLTREPDAGCYQSLRITPERKSEAS
jgi:hypothetical protein